MGHRPVGMMMMVHMWDEVFLIQLQLDLISVFSYSLSYLDMDIASVAGLRFSNWLCA